MKLAGESSVIFWRVLVTHACAFVREASWAQWVQLVSQLNEIDTAHTGSISKADFEKVCSRFFHRFILRNQFGFLTSDLVLVRRACCPWIIPSLSCSQVDSGHCVRGRVDWVSELQEHGELHDISARNRFLMTFIFPQLLCLSYASEPLVGLQKALAVLTMYSGEDAGNMAITPKALHDALIFAKYVVIVSSLSQKLIFFPN